MPIRPGLELDEALAAFATTRSSELSRAIETLGREALDGFTPPAPRKNMEFHRAWQALAVEPARRTWCLDTILDKLPKLSDGKETSYGDKCEALIERMQTLRAQPPDPRVGRAMLALFQLRSPVMGFVIADEELARVLIQHADDETRGSPVIAELTRVPEVAKILMRQLLPKPVVLDAATQTRAKSVKPTKRDVSALFAAVYAAPDADEPREILADALQEANDPRGEFIALQLREARGDASDELRDRAQELVQLHGKTWLGPLRPVTYRAAMRRGFLHRLELAGSWSANNWQEVAAEPMLATCDELLAGQGTGSVYASFLAGSIAATIRSIEVFDDAIWKVVTTTALPRLTGLLVCDLATWEPLPKSVRARITELGLGDDLGDCVDVWQKHRGLRTLQCDRGYEPIVLVREGKREFARVLSSRLGTEAPKLRRLPKSIKRVEVVNNATQAKELAKEFKRLEIVAVRPPSGTITGVK